MTHLHKMVKCRECDCVIQNCRCAAIDKMIVYEQCSACKRKQNKPEE